MFSEALHGIVAILHSTLETSGYRNPRKNLRKQLVFGQKPVQTNEGDHEEPMGEESSSALGLNNAEEVEESNTLPEVVCEQELQVNDNLIIRALNSKSPSNVAEIIREHCPHVLSSLRLLISEEINTACQKLCRRSDGSVLYGHSYQSLKDISFDSVWNEIESNIPFPVSIMNAVCGKSFTTPDLRVKYGFIYSILMSERWHELSLLKRVNTVLIIEGGCTKKLQERLNKLGVCLSNGRRDILFKLLGGHFADKVVQKVKGGSVFRGTGNNWDLKVLKGHMRKDVQNEDLHLFASNLIENRVNFSHLPNVHPKEDIVNFPRQHFSLNVDEWKVYINCAKILTGRIIVEFFPKFKWLKLVIPAHISHIYSGEMAQKSTIVSLPLLNANEAKYEDCVSILRSYEQWISEIYVKAGLLDEVPHVDNPDLPDILVYTTQVNGTFRTR